MEDKPASADGRRTSGRFFANLGRNSLRLFSRDNLGPFLIGAAVTGAGSLLDDDAQRYFEERRRAKWLGDAADQLGRPRVLVPLAGVLYGLGRLSSRHQRFRDASYDIGQVFIISAAYTTALKEATRRERPNGSNKRSFPSGHTSDAFAWATVGAHYYGPKLGVPAFAVASLVGLGRVEKGAHHVSDVLAGATLGYLVGRSVVRRDSDPLPGEKQVRLEPLAVPGGGFGLSFSLTF